jgi:hypothetical protein
MPRQTLYRRGESDQRPLDITSQLLSTGFLMATEPPTVDCGHVAIYSKKPRALSHRGGTRSFAEQTNMEFTMGIVLDAEIKLARCPAGFYSR